jgi:hypothetical protein
MDKLGNRAGKNYSSFIIFSTPTYNRPHCFPELSHCGVLSQQGKAGSSSLNPPNGEPGPDTGRRLTSGICFSRVRGFSE